MSQLLALYMGSLILRSIGIALVAGICSWKIRNVAKPLLVVMSKN